MRRLSLLLCVVIFGCSEGESDRDPSIAEIARTLGLTVAEVEGLGRERSLAPHELLRMPRAKLERALKRLRTPKPDHPGEWAEWRMSFWRDEFGRVPADALQRARQEMAVFAPQGVLGGGGLSALEWEEIGPGNIGGRVRAIAPDPVVAGRLFCGGVAGGLWRSEDDGQTWDPIDDFFANLAITCIVYDPTDSDVLYAGTGEGYFNADAIRGEGILKSVDGGDTWDSLLSTLNPDFYYVNRIAIAPDGSAILAATNRGLFRSTDGGNSWTGVDTGINRRADDVDFHPTNSLLAVQGFYDYDFGISSWIRGVRFSVDGGLTWTTSTGINPPTPGGSFFRGRCEMAWHPGWTGAGNGCVYVIRDEGSGTLYRSTDGGASFTLVSNPTMPSLLGNQGWYANALWIDPTDTNADVNDDFLLIGGLDIFRSTDGGQSFAKVSQWYSWPQSAHADHHIIVEKPGFDGVNNKVLYFGNDGGVWRTDDYTTVDLTTGWINLNSELGITQFYGASGHGPSGTIIGGTQDNGTLRFLPGNGANAWNQTFGGDGGYCASDPTDGNYHYGEYVNLRIHRSSDGGQSAQYICGIGGSNNGWNPAPYLIPDARDGFANFIAPFILDPNDANRLLAGGRSLWRTEDPKTATAVDFGPTWTEIKPPSSNSNISAIAVADGDSDIVWVGHNNGDLYRTTNGTAASPTWVRRDQTSPNLPGRRITRITIDPSNQDRVIVTQSGFANDNFWQTTDGGLTWVQGFFMPAAPLRDAEFHPTLPDVIYVASELGILVTEDNGISWSSTFYGPANVSVDELFWLDDELYAVTHGRGIFRQEPTPEPSSLGPSGSGNVGVDFGPVTDVLRINGLTGGADRRVDAFRLLPFTFSLDQPPGYSGPAPFIIWGRLGVPDGADVTAIPPGIGTMCFPPCVLAPADPTLFTLASSFPGDPCGTIFPVTAAPWSLTVPSPFTLPITFTFQGVVLAAPGQFRVTNGVIMNLR